MATHYSPRLPPLKHTVLSGQTYAYTHHSPSQSGKPTLLFLHGFPATSHEWHHQVSHFSAAGYGVLAPDLLGYGGTSKPSTVAPYEGKSMAADIVSLLDHVGKQEEKVIGISHDWGTYLLSQLAIWYPSRFSKLVFMSVPFSPPGRGLDVAKINEATKRKTGFEQFGYQVFLASENGGRIIGENWESFFNLVYPADATIWASKFAPLGSMKSAIQSSISIPRAPWISASDMAFHHEAFGNDYSAPCKWYVRGIRNLGVDEEKRALAKGEIAARLCEPGRSGGAGKWFDGEVLMVNGLKDPVCPAAHARISMNSTVAGGEKGGRLKVVDVDTGHWIMLEMVTETNRILGEFFEGKTEEGRVKANL